MHHEDCNCDECWTVPSSNGKIGKQTKKVSKQYSGPPRTTDRHRKPGVKDYKNEAWVNMQAQPELLPPLTHSPYEEDMQHMIPLGAVGEAQPREHRLPEARPRHE